MRGRLLGRCMLLLREQVEVGEKLWFMRRCWVHEVEDGVAGLWRPYIYCIMKHSIVFIPGSTFNISDLDLKAYGHQSQDINRILPPNGRIDPRYLASYQCGSRCSKGFGGEFSIARQMQISKTLIYRSRSNMVCIKFQFLGRRFETMLLTLLSLSHLLSATPS
jgi:hypothetical protein